jgi:hypothetical protein
MIENSFYLMLYNLFYEDYLIILLFFLMNALNLEVSLDLYCLEHFYLNHDNKLHRINYFSLLECGDPNMALNILGSLLKANSMD